FGQQLIFHYSATCQHLFHQFFLLLEACGTFQLLPIRTLNSGRSPFLDRTIYHILKSNSGFRK
ncbi:hypothetical protein L9F63_016296, partial [Diploptera punctata]